ncbi:hypothetical protein C030_02086, partial [Brucella abortus 85/69]
MSSQPVSTIPVIDVRTIPPP